MSTRTNQLPRACPRCLLELNGYPAISRRDGRTVICAACGTQEALVDLARNQGYVIPELQVLRELRIADRVEAQKRGII